MIRIRQEDQHVVEVFPGVLRRTLACGKDVLMARFEYREGARVPPHRHSYEQVTTLLKGEQKVIIRNEGKEKVLIIREGETYIVPAHYEHEQVVLKESVTIDAWSLAL